MKVDIVTVGEPVPTGDSSVRLLRHGIIGDLLTGRGHEVLWWNSTFDHQRKCHRHARDTSLEVRPGYRVNYLHSVGYRSNVSLSRMADHAILARKYRSQARSSPPPDVILASFPPVELAAAAVEHGRLLGIPVVLDVRDMWPDIFLDVLPRPLRGVARLALSGLERQAQFAIGNATCVSAMSEGVFHWALEKSGRRAGPHDSVFPLAYRPVNCSDERRAAAAARLRDLGVDESKLICWFIGGFGRHYDVATVVAAARELERRGIDRVQFVLCGEGEQRVPLSESARGLRNVVFTGWADPPQIAHLMRVSGVGLVAVNARPGTLPNKLFEYLSAGLPVLSSIAGEAEDLIRSSDCGFTYRTGDAGGLVAGVVQLLDDDRRARMADNARALFESRFSAGVVYPRMVDLLETVANAPSPRRQPSPLAT